MALLQLQLVVAIAAERPVTVVLGDLALLHDLNSLAMANNLNSSFCSSSYK